MNCAESPPRLGLALLLLLSFLPVCSQAGEAFSFDIKEIEKKPLEWGGFTEFKWEHMDINQGSSFSLLNLTDEPTASMDRFSGSMQLDGIYSRNLLSLKWLLKAAGQQDNLGRTDFVDIYETYGSIKPSTIIKLNQIPA